MRLRLVGLWGVVGLTLCGCPEPDQIVQVAPPGAVIPRTPPEEQPAEAQGETALAKPAAENKPEAYAPALPTAKGEIKTTKGGVKYETLKAGNGPDLVPGKVGVFHYEGKLENGTVFDGTKGKSPAPFTIGTGRLIKGWEEALPGMRVGETRKLTIPPAMAYGDRETGKIPPNSTLIFEVELLELK